MSRLLQLTSNGRTRGEAMAERHAHARVDACKYVLAEVYATHQAKGSKAGAGPSTIMAHHPKSQDVLQGQRSACGAAATAAAAARQLLALPSAAHLVACPGVERHPERA